MIVAGWYQDNQNPYTQRWWDGAEWTRHTRPMPVAQPLQPAVVQQVVVNNAPPVVIGGGIGGWHLFHFIMTVLTLGLWLPIWIIHAIVGGR